jgi:hypothetical protein
MKRYIALLMRDSVIVSNVIRMNVDIVFIGSLIPPRLALVCR